MKKKNGKGFNGHMTVENITVGKRRGGGGGGGGC